ncbi:hypothetical protein J2W42_002246 [Rhizobium tibeticum]|uniref:hypothetical protein n=1 Tax=Rhizobium tibeticum TaxID=501024 RepID=UPI00278641DA|nr:hypothetical protein [Rhizobium tibeticum]MDP9809398.1 hypothetical protein [Rhizobium tibeticum]
MAEWHRSAREKKANELDLEMFNLVRRLEEFATAALPAEVQCFRAVARQLNANRFHVQKYMHKRDLEAIDA